MSDGKTKFIRVRGRIVPIRNKTESHAKTGALVGALAGAALAAPKRLKPTFGSMRELAQWRKQTATVLANAQQVPKISPRAVLRNPSFRASFKSNLMGRVARDTVKAGLFNALALGTVGAVVGNLLRKKKK